MEGNLNEITFQHDDTQPIEGVYLVEHFFVEKDRVECPAFSNVPEGSWITTYWVKDKAQYNELLNNEEFNGFSIEIAARFEEEFSKASKNQHPELTKILNAIDLLYDSVESPEETVKAITNYLNTKNLI